MIESRLGSTFIMGSQNPVEVGLGLGPSISAFYTESDLDLRIAGCQVQPNASRPGLYWPMNRPDKNQWLLNHCRLKVWFNQSPVEL